MTRRYSPNKLLVEGDEDKRVLPELMEANGIRWGDTRHEAVVLIDACDGFSNLVKPGVIETELKASGLEALGIMADANDKLEKRWASLRARCLASFPNFPNHLPAEGLIHDEGNGLKVGVWLLPDNQSHGMLETFLTHLVPDQTEPVLKYAEDARDRAKALGAPYKNAHADKAKIHTWLAWQDPPGRPLHNAVMERILDPSANQAGAFVAWFRTLFGL